MLSVICKVGFDEEASWEYLFNLYLSYSSTEAEYTTSNSDESGKLFVEDKKLSGAIQDGARLERPEGKPMFELQREGLISQVHVKDAEGFVSRGKGKNK